MIKITYCKSVQKKKRKEKHFLPLCQISKKKLSPYLSPCEMSDAPTGRLTADHNRN